MRMLTPILSALAGLAAGIFLGLLLAPASPMPQSLPGISDADTAEAPARHDPTESSPAGQGEQPAAEPQPEPEPQAPAGLREVLRRIPLQEPVRGEGVIRGRIVDEAGNGVPGFEFLLRTEDGLPPLRFPQQRDYPDADSWIEARVVNEYLRSRRQELSTLTAHSDSQGNVTFEGVPGAKARLIAGPGDYLLNGRPSLSVYLEVGGAFEIVAIRGCRVTLEVNESPFEISGRCHVAWHSLDGGAGGGSCSVPHGGTATVLIAPGRYSFKARSDSPKLESEETVLNLVTGVPAGAAFTLSQTGGLTGVVRFSGAKPRSYQVFLAPAIAGASDDEVYGASRGSGSNVVHLDRKTGMFRYEARLDGEYMIGVVTGISLAASRRVSFRGEPERVEFDIAAPTDGTLLNVSVQCPNGIEPGSQPSFAVIDADKGRSVPVDLWDVSETEFLLHMREYNGSTLPDTAHLEASVSQLGNTSVSFRPGVDRSLTVTFAKPADVLMRVKGLPPNLHAEYEYLYGPGFKRRRHLPVHQARLSSGGSEKLPPMQPGVYRFVVKERTHFAFAIVEQEVELKPGESNVQLDIPKLYSVKLDGSGCSPYSHANLARESTGESRHFTFSDEGLAIFNNLPPGRYTVNYTAGGIHGAKKTESFTLPGPETVLLPG